MRTGRKPRLRPRRTSGAVVRMVRTRGSALSGGWAEPSEGVLFAVEQLL